ncbi:hypothetical protein HOY82DRAFT_492264 [Tuber indicum]|nr:hypothetical protein HOY82DRAFT_492264 [Tuber indicum]
MPKPAEKSPTPLTFDSRDQFFWNMISLSGRCLTTALSLSFLVLGLLIFSRMGELSRWEQRGFNTITILLSAFASLGLGSMLGYLGSMLRWPLLARKKYKMQDVELLLAMPSPSGSALLIFAHLREWRRLSLTTFIVMLYLVVNITGRFSVAIFGLTFNLADIPVITPPTLITNWSSTVLLAKDATDFKGAKKELPTLTQRPKIEFNATDFLNLTENTLDTLAVKDTDLRQHGAGVEFTYSIRDFNGTEPMRSDHTVHSSASCTMFRLIGNEYWKDYAGSAQTAKEWEDEENKDAIAEVLRVLYRVNAWPGRSSDWVTWAATLAGGSNTSSVTYVVYGQTAWECTSTISERQGQTPHPQPLFNSAPLFLLPIASEEDPGDASTSEFSTTEDVIEYPKTYTMTSVAKSTSRTSPSVGVQKLNFYRYFDEGPADQKEYYSRYVSALVARLPIAAIVYGNQKIFPRKSKDPNARPTRRVHTTLEVKWGRVGIAAGVIVVGQIIAITAVLCYCRNVYIREDSHLATAELLKTVLNGIGDGSMMTTEELENTLDSVLKGPVSYGTVPGAGGEYPRVALGRNVNYSFPEYSTLRKRGSFRR